MRVQLEQELAWSAEDVSLLCGSRQDNLRFFKAGDGDVERFGVAGYQPHYLEDTPDGAVGEAGFLMGAAGIGVALLSAAYPVEPCWDRVLMASLPMRTM